MDDTLLTDRMDTPLADHKHDGAGPSDALFLDCETRLKRATPGASSKDRAQRLTDIGFSNDPHGYLDKMMNLSPGDLGRQRRMRVRARKIGLKAPPKNDDSLCQRDGLAACYSRLVALIMRKQYVGEKIELAEKILVAKWALGLRPGSKDTAPVDKVKAEINKWFSDLV